MNDTQENIGKLLKGKVSRDAIHIAVAPMIAGDHMLPGQHVALHGADTAIVTGKPIGIVDPFLKNPVMPGDRFYVFLYPGTITSLHHQWSHPAFSGEVEESLRWLTRFAEENETTYEHLMQMLHDGQVFFSSTHWQDTLFSEWRKEDFWEHVENVLGRRVSEKEREGTSFRCAC